MRKINNYLRKLQEKFFNHGTINTSPRWIIVKRKKIRQEKIKFKKTNVFRNFDHRRV